MDFYLTTIRAGQRGDVKKWTGIMLSAISNDIRQWVEAGLYERVEVRDVYGNLVAHWPRILRSSAGQRSHH
ncbi:MAG TPA: hypothetical protein VL405_02360 [Sphingomonas sp.]|jgi:hypothetical protein|nr:hypothetical protein [Sphingomonas sp.]